MKQAARRIAWGEEIDVPRRPHIYRVISPKPREPHCVGVMLCSQLTRVHTHYIKGIVPGAKGRPAPHWTPYTECEGCMLLNQRPRVKWYGPIFLPGNSRIAIAEFTEGAPEVEPRIVDKEFDLRGWMVRLYRLGNDPRSRMGVELIRREDPKKLPKDVPVKPSLAVLWGLQENALPPINEGGEGGDL